MDTKNNILPLVISRPQSNKNNSSKKCGQLRPISTTANILSSTSNIARNTHSAPQVGISRKDISSHSSKKLLVQSLNQHDNILLNGSPIKNTSTKDTINQLMKANTDTYEWSKRHCFIIYNGEAVTNTSDFRTFQKTFQSSWISINKLITKLQQLLLQYHVSLGVVNGSQLAMLATRHHRHPLSSDKTSSHTTTTTNNNSDNNNNNNNTDDTVSDDDLFECLTNKLEVKLSMYVQQKTTTAQQDHAIHVIQSQSRRFLYHKRKAVKRKQETCIVIIQRYIRGYLCRQRLSHQLPLFPTSNRFVDKSKDHYTLLVTECTKPLIAIKQNPDKNDIGNNRKDNNSNMSENSKCKIPHCMIYIPTTISLQQDLDPPLTILFMLKDPDLHIIYVWPKPISNALKAHMDDIMSQLSIVKYSHRLHFITPSTLDMFTHRRSMNQTGDISTKESITRESISVDLLLWCDVPALHSLEAFIKSLSHSMTNTAERLHSIQDNIAHCISESPIHIPASNISTNMFVYILPQTYSYVTRRISDYLNIPIFSSPPITTSLQSAPDSLHRPLPPPALSSSMKSKNVSKYSKSDHRIVDRSQYNTTHDLADTKVSHRVIFTEAQCKLLPCSSSLLSLSVHQEDEILIHIAKLIISSLETPVWTLMYTAAFHSLSYPRYHSHNTGNIMTSSMSKYTDSWDRNQYSYVYFYPNQLSVYQSLVDYKQKLSTTTAAAAAATTDQNESSSVIQENDWFNHNTYVKNCQKLLKCLKKELWTIMLFRCNVSTSQGPQNGNKTKVTWQEFFMKLWKSSLRSRHSAMYSAVTKLSAAHIQCYLEGGVSDMIGTIDSYCYISPDGSITYLQSVDHLTLPRTQQIVPPYSELSSCVGYISPQKRIPEKAIEGACHSVCSVLSTEYRVYGYVTIQFISTWKVDRSHIPCLYGYNITYGIQELLTILEYHRDVLCIRHSFASHIPQVVTSTSAQTVTQTRQSELCNLKTLRYDHTSSAINIVYIPNIYEPTLRVMTMAKCIAVYKKKGLQYDKEHQKGCLYISPSGYCNDHISLYICNTTSRSLILSQTMKAISCLTSLTAESSSSSSSNSAMSPSTKMPSMKLSTLVPKSPMPGMTQGYDDGSEEEDFELYKRSQLQSLQLTISMRRICKEDEKFMSVVPW